MSRPQMSKKRKFVKDGVFQAELNEFMKRHLSEDGYAGVEVRLNALRTEIILRVTRAREVLGERGRRIRELTLLVQKRFGYPPDSVELLAERVEARGLCAMAQAESLRYKLLKGLSARRACYGILRNVMDNGAKGRPTERFFDLVWSGCEVIVSGKLRAQRAKTMKFKDGYMIATGNPVHDYIDEAVRSVQMRQGVLGIKVKIMLPHDPTGKTGPVKLLPDQVIVHEPPVEPTLRLDYV